MPTAFLYIWSIVENGWKSIGQVTLRNPHLEKSYLVGLFEVGVPEVHQVSESPTLLIMFLCTVFGLMDSFGVLSIKNQCILAKCK